MCLFLILVRLLCTNHRRNRVQIRPRASADVLSGGALRPCDGCSTHCAICHRCPPQKLSWQQYKSSTTLVCIIKPKESGGGRARARQEVNLHGCMDLNPNSPGHPKRATCRLALDEQDRPEWHRSLSHVQLRVRTSAEVALQSWALLAARPISFSHFHIRAPKGGLVWHGCVSKKKTGKGSASDALRL